MADIAVVRLPNGVVMTASPRLVAAAMESGLVEQVNGVLVSVDGVTEEALKRFYADTAAAGSRRSAQITPGRAVLVQLIVSALHELYEHRESMTSFDKDILSLVAVRAALDAAEAEAARYQRLLNAAQDIAAAARVAGSKADALSAVIVQNGESRLKGGE